MNKPNDPDLTTLPDSELTRLKYWTALRGAERVELRERIEKELERRKQNES